MWLISRNWSIYFLIALAVSSLFFLTWTCTSIRCLLAIRGNYSTPLIPPYIVPWLGHTIAFAVNTEQYLISLRSRFGTVPVRLLIGPDVWTFMPVGETILSLFKSREVNSKLLTIRALRDLFGFPQEFIKLLESDGSGSGVIPNAGFEDFAPEMRPFFHMSKALHTLTQADTLNSMFKQFLRRYVLMLESKTNIKYDEWAVIDDLYDMMKNDLFRASTEALCGSHIFQVSPYLAEDFWKFDQIVPEFFKFPRWLIPRHYEIRTRLLLHLKNFHAWADKNFDWTNQELVSSSWEPIYEVKVMRMNQQLYRKFGPDATADNDLGIIWATSSNVIPSAFWTTLGVLKSGNLKQRYLKELDDCFYEHTINVNIEKLSRGSLSLSMYHESLRYAVGLLTFRSPNYDGYRIGKWQFNKNDHLVTSSWSGHRDKSFWNTGRTLPNGQDEHPVDTWWAERFLQYPGDPCSGPIRNPDPEVYRGDKAKERTSDDDKAAKVVTAGTGGHLFPYGGGAKICPGRFFAKNEMIASVAVMMRMYEIELIGPAGAEKVGLDMRFFPLGALPPNGKVSVRIRRRRLKKNHEHCRWDLEGVHQMIHSRGMSILYRKLWIVVFTLIYGEWVYSVLLEAKPELMMINVTHGDF